MELRLTAEERDAIYEHVIAHLSGIGDLWIAVERNDYETATRLGREFADELHLVLDDLRWGDQLGGEVELRTPPDVLRRVFSRIRQLAVEQQRVQAEERAELDQLVTRNRLVSAACNRVLAAVEA